jgi:hypothetical protein
LRFEEKGERKRYMKQCVVCGAEIKTELEEFGDPREPVCAPCWLYGYLEEPAEIADKKEIKRRSLYG